MLNYSVAELRHTIYKYLCTPKKDCRTKRYMKKNIQAYNKDNKIIK